MMFRFLCKLNSYLLVYGILPPSTLTLVSNLYLYLILYKANQDPIKAACRKGSLLHSEGKIMNVYALSASKWLL